MFALKGPTPIIEALLGMKNFDFDVPAGDLQIRTSFTVELPSARSEPTRYSDWWLNARPVLTSAATHAQTASPPLAAPTSSSTALQRSSQTSVARRPPGA